MDKLGSKTTIFKGCNTSLFTENPTTDDLKTKSRICPGSNPGGTIIIDWLKRECSKEMGNNSSDD